MNLTRSALTTSLLLIASAPAASAGAAGWTPSNTLYPGCGKPAYNCTSEPAPRAAVNARGQSVIAWVDGHRRVRVKSASAKGRFGASAVLGTGLRPAVAISPGGTQTVVWSAGGALRFASRAPGHRFTAPKRLVPATSKIGDDDAKLAGQPDGSTLVVYENSYRDAKGKYTTRLRSVLISAAGKPGATQTLGLGSMGRDTFRAVASGQASVCCLQSPGVAPLPYAGLRSTTIANFLPAGGWSSFAAPIDAGTDLESVAPGGGAVALGTVDVHNSGDAGTLGVPGLLRLGADGTFGSPHPAPVLKASRAFGPAVAIDGAGRDVLVYQEKDGSAAFSRTAPVYGVTAGPGGAFGARQVLDAERAYLPLVRAYGSGAIVAWETPTNRWRVSVERGGTFTPAAAPAGGPSIVGEDFNYSRDIATAGRYAVLTWTAIDGSIRASIGVL